MASGFASTSGKQVRRYLDKTARKELGNISDQRTIKSKMFVLLSVIKSNKINLQRKT